MLFHIINAVSIVNLSVNVFDISCSEAIFYDHQRNLITVPDLIKNPPQSFGINLPSPFRCIKIGILHSTKKVPGRSVSIGIDGYTEGHIVTECIEVDCPPEQNLLILRFHIDRNSVLSKETPAVGRVSASHLNIRTIPIDFAHVLLCRQHIIGITCCRIIRKLSDHAAHLELRIMLMRISDYHCRCDKLMVQCLITYLHGTVRLVGRSCISFERTRFNYRSREESSAIDLVKSQPIFNFILITIKNHLAKFHVEINQLSVNPTIVLLDQRIRQFVMGDRHKRFNTMFPEAVKDIIVKLKSRLIWYILLPSREDSCPVDGHPEHFKAHFRKKRDRDCHSFSVHIPGAFYLVRGCCAAPQKILGKSIHDFLLSDIMRR